MKNNEIIKTLMVVKPNPWQKTAEEARLALVVNEKHVRHIKLADRYVPAGKAYKREVRKSDRRYNAMIRKMKSAENFK